jgi:hypothetical protein
MSASEKLRALERGQALEGRLPHWETDGDLLKALPQIVAVVEAAEMLDRDRQAFGYGKEQHIPNQLALAEALVSLDEALW